MHGPLNVKMYKMYRSAHQWDSLGYVTFISTNAYSVVLSYLTQDYNVVSYC